MNNQTWKEKYNQIISSIEGRILTIIKDEVQTAKEVGLDEKIIESQTFAIYLERRIDEKLQEMLKESPTNMNEDSIKLGEWISKQRQKHQESEISGNEDSIKLGEWISKQRQKHQKSEISGMDEDQLKIIESLNDSKESGKHM